MSDKTEAVKRHLGREISERELTHYSLLGVSNDASVEQIRVAIRVRVAAFNASDVKNAPESAQLAATMIKQAQAVLLDNVKRREYDLSLAVKQPTIQLALFPDADPFATFNPAECLVGAVAALPTEPFGNPSQRWQELKSKLPILAEWESVPPQKPTPTILLAEPPHPRADAGKTSDILARISQMKRKRKAKQRLYTIGFLSFAIAFLAFAAFRFMTIPSQVAKLDGGPRNHAEPLRSKPNATSESTEGKVQLQEPENAQHSSLPSLVKDEVESLIGPVDAGQETVMVSPLLTRKNEDAQANAPLTSPPMNNVPASDAVPLGPEAAAQCVAAMKSARQAIEAANFIAFHEQIQIAHATATKELQAKCKRLDQLGQLYEIFIKSVKSTKSKVEAGDTVTVGKQRISIVEIGDTEIVVRIQGNRESYAWDRLPPGLATAMADLALSKESATDLAARAVYFSISPARNELSSQKAKEWFEKSVGKEEIREDLPQALTDTYE